MFVRIRRLLTYQVNAQRTAEMLCHIQGNVVLSLRVVLSL